MKKSYLFPILILVVCLSLPVVALAEEGEVLSSKGDDSSKVETKMMDREDKELRIQQRIEEGKKVKVEDSDNDTSIEKRKENQERNMEKRCEVVGDLVAKRITIFEETKDNHIANYNKLLSRLNDVVAKLKAKGFEVTTLEADIATLDSMIKAYTNKYVSFITILKSSQNVVCGESDGAYKDKLEEAKGMLQELKKDRRTIKEFYLGQIRNDIKTLRQQAVENSTMEDNQ